MKEQGYNLRLLLYSVVSLLGFSWMAVVYRGERMSWLDQSVILFVQGFESPMLTSIMEFFSLIGSWKIVFALLILMSCLFFIRYKYRSELFLLWVVIIAAKLINPVLKQLFLRERPEFNRLIEISGYSFPSGHAMNAFATYGILTFLLWRHMPARIGRLFILTIASFIILMIGISRIYLGVHYSSDIIGGYFASGFILTFSIWFYKRMLTN